MKLAAVVVTFNRKALLRECLDALLGQTRPLDAIYVVDNASSDGTPEFLRERGFLDRPSIRYVRLETNIGGAGGFHAGMKAAYEAGSDWIWIMDDDSIAEPDALEAMLPLISNDGICAIANQKLQRDRSIAFAHVSEAPVDAGDKTSYKRLTFSSFVGLMVRKEAIAQIGLPKAEFFIYQDDIEYCRRLNLVGHIALAPLSRIVHKELNRADRQKRFLGRSYKSLPTAQFCMHFYFAMRNQLWNDLHSTTTGRSRAFFSNVRTCSKMCLHAVLIDREDVLLRLWTIIRAFSDGVRQNFDNAFPFRLRAKLK